eukprot:scaffold80840_cov37-Prasinocladus_malaysianus.AAC.1
MQAAQQVQPDGGGGDESLSGVEEPRARSGEHPGSLRLVVHLISCCTGLHFPATPVRLAFPLASKQPKQLLVCVAASAQ